MAFGCWGREQGRPWSEPFFCPCVRLSASLSVLFSSMSSSSPSRSLLDSLRLSHQVTWGGLLLGMWFRQELEAAAKPTCSWPCAP